VPAMLPVWAKIAFRAATNDTWGALRGPPPQKRRACPRGRLRSDQTGRNWVNF